MTPADYAPEYEPVMQTWMATVVWYEGSGFSLVLQGVPLARTGEGQPRSSYDRLTAGEVVDIIDCSLEGCLARLDPR